MKIIPKILFNTNFSGKIQMYIAGSKDEKTLLVFALNENLNKETKLKLCKSKHRDVRYRFIRDPDADVQLKLANDKVHAIELGLTYNNNLCEAAQRILLDNNSLNVIVDSLAGNRNITKNIQLEIIDQSLRKLYNDCFYDRKSLKNEVSRLKIIKVLSGNPSLCKEAQIELYKVQNSYIKVDLSKNTNLCEEIQYKLLDYCNELDHTDGISGRQTAKEIKFNLYNNLITSRKVIKILNAERELERIEFLRSKGIVESDEDL